MNLQERIGQLMDAMESSDFFRVTNFSADIEQLPERDQSVAPNGSTVVLKT